MNVLTGLDVTRRASDDRSVLDYLGAGGHVVQRDLVSKWDLIGDGNFAAGAFVEIGDAERPGAELGDRNGDRVAGAMRQEVESLSAHVTPQSLVSGLTAVLGRACRDVNSRWIAAAK